MRLWDLPKFDFGLTIPRPSQMSSRLRWDQDLSKSVSRLRLWDRDLIYATAQEQCNYLLLLGFLWNEMKWKCSDSKCVITCVKFVSAQKLRTSVACLFHIEHGVNSTTYSWEVVCSTHGQAPVGKLLTLLYLCIRGFFTTMHYMSRHFAFLLTYSATIHATSVKTMDVTADYERSVVLRA